MSWRYCRLLTLYLMPSRATRATKFTHHAYCYLNILDEARAESSRVEPLYRCASFCLEIILMRMREWARDKFQEHTHTHTNRVLLYIYKFN